jgi:hypothetical protein
MTDATQTAALESLVRRRIASAMDRLTNALKRYLRAYPMLEGDKMPEHDLVWVTGSDGGPERVILEALKATPELWLQALPPEVCIVPREALKSLGLDEDVVALLAEKGAYIVDAHAANHRQEAYLQKWA